MKVVATDKENSIITVQIAESVLCDVKVLSSGLVYVMQEENGETAYNDKGYPVKNPHTNQEIIDFIKDYITKRGNKCDI